MAFSMTNAKWTCLTCAHVNQFIETCVACGALHDNKDETKPTAPTSKECCGGLAGHRGTYEEWCMVKDPAQSSVFSPSDEKHIEKWIVSLCRLGDDSDFALNDLKTENVICHTAKQNDAYVAEFNKRIAALSEDYADDDTFTYCSMFVKIDALPANGNVSPEMYPSPLLDEARKIAADNHVRVEQAHKRQEAEREAKRAKKLQAKKAKEAKANIVE